ncbi:hypothetical protein [Roseococcus sp. SYP-B2431]|uniref:hypothetical protein n=1 Tax=Roseococcus sp. SYP-B2431 TaxID=2496640 RepID=UPI0013F45B83|nr:hypothetical protein [Roseococcus sp. SYP-B2431]
MDVQLLPHREGEGPVEPDRVLKNSMEEEGEPKGDGWVALLGCLVLLAGVGVMALMFR